MVITLVQSGHGIKDRARGLEWTLPRTIDALEHLEAALANTGQILARIGHHSYMLSPRPGLLHHREIARCLRHTRDPLDLPAVKARCCTAPSPVRGRTAPATCSATLRSTLPLPG